MIRSYSELILLPSFSERLDYLTLNDGGAVHPRRDRYYRFLKSEAWLRKREQIIARDMAFDIAVPGVSIYDKVIVHHINPITDYDLDMRTNKLFDDENLITVSIGTHNTIHYGVAQEFVERKPGDTILW